MKQISQQENDFRDYMLRQSNKNMFGSILKDSKLQLESALRIVTRYVNLCDDLISENRQYFDRNKMSSEIFTCIKLLTRVADRLTLESIDTIEDIPKQLVENQLEMF